jgi:hypothetical protein
VPQKLAEAIGLECFGTKQRAARDERRKAAADAANVMQWHHIKLDVAWLKI